MSKKENFPFARSKAKETGPVKKWKILIVDDVKEVHLITCSVLKKFMYENRELEFLHAYSGEEAKKIMAEQTDIALILLDVVMEHDDSGLEVARYIREDLDNKFVQIILRTGQPGSAPEKSVISNYEINDYKEKTELTSTKLFTIVLTSLRSYKNLMSIEKNRLGLEKIIDSTRTLFNNQDECIFIEGVLTQMEALLHLDDDSLYVKRSGFSAVHQKDDNYTILSSTGNFRDVPKLTSEIRTALEHAVKEHKSYFHEDIYVGYFQIGANEEHLIYLQGCRYLSETSQKMIYLFTSKVAIAMENLYLIKEINETKKEIIYTLGNVVESRSKETAFHVQRVAELSYLLAKEYGLDENEAMLLKNASPMHDIGKVGISDSILLKKGRLDDNEFEEMKRHAQIGYDILKGSERDLIKAAAIVAHQHHERYDGNGYPRGLKGEDIHIFGRITMIADVFDALYYKRCYKDPWPVAKILDYFKEEKEKMFDPLLTDLFMKNLDKILEINKNFMD